MSADKLVNELIRLHKENLKVWQSAEVNIQRLESGI